ncbi:unnamed protein product [Rotaria socialis]|uniref:Peptidase S1 domain-containing protein n=2 Tax=Rotaria socialis TaxID=392032 RepID=A0A821F637_9BILA|nr:unnamed protein product [Rotaria socialis]CAF4536177.1 unnamed protein product [Rotaria socialis]CAF4646200.1 unnamed protein product [Rotaria socialis]
MYRTCFFIMIYFPIIHAFTCGQSSIKPNDLSSTKIINGTEARPHSWPWIVSLQHPLLGHFCGGSVIDANYVISAAHCFFNIFFYDSIVFIGNHYLTDRVEYRTISAVIIHPLYTLVDGSPDDIVLLKLNQSIDIKSYPPICLPTNDSAILELPGQRLTIAGWGLTNESESSNVLLQTTLSIFDSSIPECHPFMNDTNKQLCVGVIGGGTGSCSVSITKAK